MRCRELGLIAIALLTPAVAWAQPSPRQQAAENFKRADLADKQGRYADAIAEYEQAYALAPHPDVLFNIATDYEHLQDWERAAEYYQRYLDERDSPATDADAVRIKIRDLRAKVPPPPPIADRQPPVSDVQPATDLWRTNLPVPVAVVEEPHWHVGGSYGLGFGDVPSERYLVHGGRTFGGRFDLDAIGGAFGRNDYALGIMARVVILRDRLSPFVRAGATIGIAKQDASSIADTRFPIGFEAGGGIQFGARGRFELAAVMRFVSGGWDSASTTADSYVNEPFTVAIDLGFSFDVPLIAAAR
jgi:hypothetical protein